MDAAIAQVYADQLDERQSVVEATVEVNDRGSYVRCVCPTPAIRSDLRPIVEEYPVWVELEVES